MLSFKCIPLLYISEPLISTVHCNSTSRNIGQVYLTSSSFRASLILEHLMKCCVLHQKTKCATVLRKTHVSSKVSQLLLTKNSSTCLGAASQGHVPTPVTDCVKWTRPSNRTVFFPHCCKQDEKHIPVTKTEI